MKHYLWIVGLFTSVLVQAQLSVTLSEITWTCTPIGDDLVMELQAPTTGWVGVGFNQENSILQSDLLLFNIVDGQATGTDLYVKGFGNPQADKALGGDRNVEILSFREEDNHTYIQFRRPLKAADAYDFQLQAGEAFWLILAYSTHDEFEHHSRVRQHQQVLFKIE